MARRAGFEAPQQFTFGDLLRSARHAHPEFRHQGRLEQQLGWPHRKVLWLEHNRISPTADDLAQLTAVLPILRVLLKGVRPVERASEMVALRWTRRAPLEWPLC